MKTATFFLLPYLVLSTLFVDVTLSQGIDCANPADIMFLMDGSDSIDAMEWNQERNFVARMINALDITPSTINVGFTVYSSVVNRHYGLSPFRPKIVLNAMARSLEHPTGIATNTATGIAKIRETFRSQPASRSNAPKIMIVITDGSSENPAETIRQAQLSKEEGIRIITVGVGNNVFVEELQQVASNQRKYYQAPDFAALRGIESDIRNMICRVITTTPSPRFSFAPPTIPPEMVPVATDQMCNVPGDIVFVIDGSDSISDADYVRLKSFVANLIDNFEIGPNAIHVGMLVYSSLIGDKHGLFPPKNKMVLKLLANNLAHPRFGTDTAAGIEAARAMIREQGRPNAPEIVVVITDGRSTNPRNTIVQASIAKAQGITMIAIGVGRDIFSEELNQIASGPNYVSQVTDFRALKNTVNVMRNLICTSITTTSTTTTTMLPPTPPPSIEPPPAGLICNVPGDVVFLLDGSDSIAANDWIRQKNFVTNLINNLEIGQPYIHVAVVVYSSQIGKTVQLVPFKPKMVLDRLIADLPQPRFGTDTALGIQESRRMLKTDGRPNAPKVIIVVTDGKSTFPDNTMIQANIAKADGITMISVGVGSDIYDDELQNIATSTAKVFKVTDFASLRNIIGSLRDRICQVVQTTTIAPVTVPPTTTTTERMTTPVPVKLYPCVESETAADLMFLIDGSKSISPYNWMMETHIVSNFLDGLHIKKQLVHVGVVISDHVRGDSVGIMPFKTRFHLKELIHGFMHPGGDMDTAMGIRKIRDIFTNQGRRDAQRVVIVVTDGSSRSRAETTLEATELKKLGADVVSVGVGNNVNEAELKALASDPRYVLRTRNVEGLFNMLPTLQNVVCSILRVPETTTMATTTPSTPGLCDGCLIDQGVGFNPYPGDCTKYVQCWKDGETIRSLIRSCPFGQFWDADAITCRPSFLVRCTADPCKSATPGFTYGMAEYGCRAYWKCIDGFSVGHCCPLGSSYVEGMGCLEGTTCNEDCPPKGGIAVKPTCNKKPHWDKRYYIEIIFGQGEIVRPCPVGTIYFEEKCSCDFGLSGLLPTTPDVMCHPSAFFPFDRDLLDKSMNGINTGVTNVRLTDLGTAYFNGRSEMNLWRFAGADWGSTLVIKFKFRFDYSNKFIDYGGLPVDLGVDFNINMNLVSDFHMTDMDWRLWNQLRNVKTLSDWRQLLREFGQSKTFYIFLGQLGFKPGTSNSLQVVRILGTPEAFAEFSILLRKMQPATVNNVNLNDKSRSGLRGILSQLRGLRRYINWDNIVRQLKGQTESTGGQTGSTGGQTGSTGGQTGSTGGQTTIIVDGQTGSTRPQRGDTMSGNGEWSWDGVKGEWVRVTGSTSGSGSGSIGTGGAGTVTNTNLLDIKGTGSASDWHWNSVTGQWERLASVGGSKLGNDGIKITTGTMNTGTKPGSWTREQKVEGSGSSWRWQAGGSASPTTGNTGTSTGSFTQTSTATSVSGGSGTGTLTGQSSMGAISWQDIMKQMQKLQNSSSSGSWKWSTQGGVKGGANNVNREAIEAILKQLKLAGGQNGSASWQWSSKGGTATGHQLDTKKLDALLKQMQAATAAKFTGDGSGSGSFNSGMFITSGGKTAVVSGGMGTNNGAGTGSQTTQVGSSKITIQEKMDAVQPESTISGGRVVGGSFATNTGSGSTGLGSIQETSSRTSGSKSTGQVQGQSTSSDGQNRGQGTVVSIVKQAIQGKSQPGVPDRSAPRGANAKGVNNQRVDGQIIGLHIPTNNARFVSGATVIGKGENLVKVSNADPQVRVSEIVQEVNPISGGSISGGTQGASGSWSFSSGGASSGSNLGSASASSQFVNREVVSGGGSGGAAMGQFTQMGQAVGTGGGVKRVIDTNVKRMPAGSVEFSADGGVSLASLGLGGADGSNIIRQTVRVESAGNGGFVDQNALGGAAGATGSQLSGFAGGASSGGQTGFSGQSGQWSEGIRGTTSGGQNAFISGNTLVGGGGGQRDFRTANLQGASTSAMLFPFISQESAENFFDGLTGRRRKKRSTSKSRSKRAAKKQDYQALVTNCQGQNGQGPSIMVVANQNDVQFAVKTYGHREPGVISVPSVEGWNDVTLIYDGSTLTGIVENWKGLHKASVNLSGNIERRQAGLLVGSCQGFASFHGEIDDIAVHQCLTPAMQELRDRVVV